MAPPSTPTTLFVCTTSHLDWDWINDFEQYYSIGYAQGQPPDNPVRYTFDQMFALLASYPGFNFSLAEMGYFRRYFVDTGTAAQQTAAAGARLCLMGGGITSPDNLLSHGEAFIRTYLLGTQWLASLGLADSRAPLAWLPDDFGHDPQLPVVLAAMGIQAVGFSRVPGSAQGTPDAKPIAGGPSLAEQLADTLGLVFPWVAADGSQVLANFMPSTYSVSTADLGSFVQAWDGSVWGGPNMFVPVPSGDFATPTTQIFDDVDAYNAAPVDGVSAILGTFQDFAAAVLADTATLPPAFTMEASNYWTGQFASRPQLKIDQHAATRSLLAAEAASALLRVSSKVATSVLDALDAQVDSVWNMVAYSTHHDFVTGTSPDQTYQVEQLPLVRRMRALARDCRRQALELVAESVAAKPSPGEIPYVVFNALGFARGGLVSIAGVGEEIGAVRIAGGGTVPVQRGAEGALLFALPTVESLGYTCVYLQSGTYTPPQFPTLGDTLTLDNGLLSVTLDGTRGWAISSLVDAESGKELVAAGELANVLTVYQDTGNLYQFGNEPINDWNGVISYGTFAAQSVIDTVDLAALVENGPLRWRFVVQLSGAGESYELVYTLVAGEPFLRIEVTGRAPNDQSSVVTVSQLGAGQTLPDGLTHGTPYHWTDVEPVRYWWGPTFQATHDYLLPTIGGSAVAAVYHGGMPAWCRDQGDQQGNGAGRILGVLFRSADGTQRGAAGKDPDRHTQRFAIGVPGAGLVPTTCVPLELGLSFSTALRACPVGTDEPVARTLPESLSLASVSTGEGVIRAVRVQTGSAGTKTQSSPVTSGVPTSFVTRVYTPANAATPMPLTLTFPGVASGSLDASLVTALELPLPTGGLPQPASSVAVSGNQADLTMGQALLTVRVATNRPYVLPNSGK